MFRGAFTARVDEKRRIRIPATFKHEIEERYDDRFFITSADGQEVEIYPLSEWEKIEEKLWSRSGEELQWRIVANIDLQPSCNL